MHCGYSDTNYIYCWHLSRSVLIVGIVSQNDKTTANLRIPCVIPSDRPLVKYLHFRQNKSQLSVTKVSFDPRTTQGSARRYSGLSPGLTSSPGLQSPGSWRLERVDYAWWGFYHTRYYQRCYLRRGYPQPRIAKFCQSWSVWERLRDYPGYPPVWGSRSPDPLGTRLWSYGHGFQHTRICKYCQNLIPTQSLHLPLGWSRISAIVDLVVRPSGTVLMVWMTLIRDVDWSSLVTSPWKFPAITLPTKLVL